MKYLSSGGTSRNQGSTTSTVSGFLWSACARPLALPSRFASARDICVVHGRPSSTVPASEQATLRLLVRQPAYAEKQAPMAFAVPFERLLHAPASVWIHHQRRPGLV